MTKQMLHAVEVWNSRITSFPPVDSPTTFQEIPRKQLLFSFYFSQIPTVDVSIAMKFIAAK